MSITFIITLIYLTTCVNKNAERGMGAVAVGAIYSALILIRTSMYYSRYNFIWFIPCFLIHIQFDYILIYVLLGGLVGPLIATGYYKLIYVNDIE